MIGHPDKEAFEAWLDNPVTRWVMRAAVESAEKNKAAWIDASWEGGVVDERLLIEYRTRADAYRALKETGYEQWLSLNETEEETAAREEAKIKRAVARAVEMVEEAQS